MSNLDSIVNASDKAIDKASGLFSWLNQPKEEARTHLIELIKEDKNLTPNERVALIYNSRKLAREYANANSVYDQAKQQFNARADEVEIDEDWLQFFFDRAEKVSNKSMQIVWSSLLAGEYNKPGSISRKLMHIISVMDVHSAKSFQTFCLYIFERKGRFTSSYNTDAAIIPIGFHVDSFDFMRKAEKWLCDAGYEDYGELAIELTMSNGELNDLENLGLIQQVQEGMCGITLVYYLENNEVVYIKPEENSEIPLGQYSLTHEGQQLHRIISNFGNEAVLKILEQYLLSLDIRFTMEKYIGSR